MMPPGLSRHRLIEPPPHPGKATARAFGGRCRGGFTADPGVAWYDRRRQVEDVNATSRRSTQACPLTVKARPDIVDDLIGTHQVRDFFTTDVTMAVAWLIETLSVGGIIEAAHEHVCCDLRQITTLDDRGPRSGRAFIERW